MALVTATSMTPAAWAGVVICSVVESTSVRPVPATPSNVTVRSPVKFPPEISTTVPPVVSPLTGDMAEMTGALPPPPAAAPAV